MKEYFELFKLGSHWFDIVFIFPLCFAVILFNIIEQDWSVLISFVPFVLILIMFNIVLGENKKLIQKLKEKNNG